MNQLTEYRREFHKYPENGWREFRTSARVAEILTGMGYDVAMGTGRDRARKRGGA